MITENKSNIFKIGIADDHEMLLEGLANRIKNREDWQLVFAAKTAEDAVANMRDKAKECDLVVLDYEYASEEINGTDIVKEAKKANPGIRSIIYTMSDSQRVFYKAMDARVNGFALKGDDNDTIIDAIETVLDYRIYVSPNVRWLRHEDIDDIFDPRDRAILKMMAEGKNNEAIGEALGLSPVTIRNRKNDMPKKYGVSNRDELIKFAASKGVYD